MPTPAQLAAAFKAARAFIDREAGFYARMIPDSDVLKLCQIVLDTATPPVSSPSTKEPQT